MNILLEGWLVLLYNWTIIAWILLTLLSGYIIVLHILKYFFEDTLQAAEYFSLGLAGSVLPILFGALVLFSQNIFQRIDLSILLLLLPAALATTLFQRRRGKAAVQRSNSTLPVLILILLVSIFLRLVFVSRITTPLYFDSAEHYRILRSLLGIYRSSQSILQTNLPVSGYYHLGFHLITAVMPSSIQWYVMDTMMLLGQIIVAMIPIPVFFIVRHETKSEQAGVFAILLAGIGWYMPAYALNWGKYPALTSLLMVQFVAGAAYAAFHSKNVQLTQWKRYALPALGIVAAGLIHARSLIVIGIIFSAWGLAKWRLNFSKPVQVWLLFLLCGGILAELIHIRSISILSVVFDPYLQSGHLLTTLVILLTVFAYRTFPQLAAASLLTIFFLLASLLIPINILSSSRGYQTLLDRPFVEMILYLPLAMLGGLGFAALNLYLHRITRRQNKPFKVIRILTSAFIAGAVFFYAFSNYNFHPSDCCQIVSSDDLVAFDWIKRNAPPDATILIATMNLDIFTSNAPEGFAGADAGIWLSSLVKRPTLGAPNSLDFSQPSTLDALCMDTVRYVYVGGTQQSFNESGLKSNPIWYRNIFSLPGARIYETIGCALDG